MNDKLDLKTAFRKMILPELRSAGFRDYSDYYGGTHGNVVRASCIKPYADRIMTAIQFIDRRGINQDLLCRLWIAPWDHADDALERLQIGMCIVVYDDYEFTDTAARGIVQRIRAIDRLAPSFREYVMAELAAPPLQTRRAEVYQAEQRLVDMVTGGHNSAVTAGWRKVLADLAELPGSRLKTSTVASRVGRFVRENEKAVSRLCTKAKAPVKLTENFVRPLDVEAYFSELVRRRAKSA